MNEPLFELQLDYFGNKEKVDTSIFSVKILCATIGCTQIRYIKPQDKHQIEYCKPHTRRLRLDRKAGKTRNKRST